MKRNIITDKDGDILEASATPANIHDSKSAYAPVAILAVAFPWKRRIYADRGYRGNFIEEARHDFGIDVEIIHSNYSGQFVPAKKRWVVERTFAWLENFKRLCRNYEETTLSGLRRDLFLRFSKSIFMIWSDEIPSASNQSANRSNRRKDLPLRRTPVIIFIIPL